MLLGALVSLVTLNLTAGLGFEHGLKSLTVVIISRPAPAETIHKAGAGRWALSQNVNYLKELYLFEW